MYNNVNNTIRVFGCDKEIVILAGERKKISVCQGLKAEFNNHIYEYIDFIPMPSEHRKFNEYFGYGLGVINLYVQINRDGNIYVIKKMDNLPLVNYLHQPNGFPVKGNRIK